ncbi:MAG: hypothetical protein QOF01_905 [Thermomicrobiales bacterium]|nr:hypothetical protein [Thermomicrobiales bacterium]
MLGATGEGAGTVRVALRTAERQSPAPPRLWQAFGLTGCLLVAAYLIIPSGTVRDILYPVFGCSAVGAILVGLRRHHPADRLAWILFAAGQAVWTFGDALRIAAPHLLPNPSISLAVLDAIYLAGYPLLIASSLRLLRRQRGHNDWGGFFNALIVAVATGVLSWVLVVAPRAEDAGGPLVERLAIVACPALDLLALSLVVRLLFSARRPSPSLALLIAGTAVLPIFDILYGLRMLTSTYHFGGAGDIGWLLSYVGYGAASLHPGMRDIGAPADSIRPSRRRLALLALVALAGPAALLVAEARHFEVDAPVLVVGTGVLFILALVRAGIALGQLEGAHQKTWDVLESITDGFCALDRDWRFTYVNREAERLLRRPRAALIGTNVWMEFPSIVDAELGNAFRGAAARGETVEVGFFYPPLDGWFEARIYPSAEGLSVYFREVTERLAAEERLRASEARFATAFRASPLAMTISTLTDGVFIDANDRFWTMSGYDRGQVIGHTSVELGLWPDPIERTAVATALAAGEAVPDHDVTARTKAGDELILRVSYERIELDGRPCLLALAQDVTDRRAAEAALAASEARFRGLVQHAADLITVVAADGTVRYQSPAIESLLGYRPEDRTGADGLAFIHPEDLPQVHRELAAIATFPGATTTMELRARHRLGTWRWLEATATNLLHDPSVAGIVVNSRDVTDRRRLEEDLRRREARHRALLDAVPDLMFRVDRSGTYLDVKAERPDSLVAPVEELLGRPVAYGLPTEVAVPILGAMERALECGRMQTVEYRLELEEGPRDFEARIVPNGVDETVSLVRDVTERRAAEERVRQSEERLRLSLEAANVGAWDWHIPTDTVVWSPTLSALLGLPPESRTTTTADFSAIFVHPDDRVRSEMARTSLATGDTFTQVEYRVVRPDGTVRWLVDVGRVVERAPDGGPLRTAGITMDVTALEAATEALRLRDRALAAISSGIVIVDATEPDQPIVDVNPAFERITGYSRDEAIGCNVLSLAHPEIDPKAFASLRQLCVEGREGTVTLLDARKVGTPFWAEVQIAPVRDSDGRLTHLVGILNDVTERRWAEEELRFRGELLDQATVAVVATDAAGVVTHWNRQAEALYGWRRSEAIGRTIPDLIVAPGEAGIAEAILRRVAEGESWEGEFVCRRKDGREVPVHVVDSPVYGADGRLMGIVGVSVDLTERKAFEGRLAYQATHDAVTGLPNRILFTERLGRALTETGARGTALAVLFLDLDGFKRVNDSLGHASGDQLLVAVGRRLAALLAPDATLARFGGDEFTVLLPNITTAHEAARVAARLLDGLRAPFVLDDQEAYVDASIGIALSSASLSRPDDLLRAADVALYQAKAAGRATYRIFEPIMAERAASRLGLESELRRAVERGELRLFYQPEVDLKTGRIVGAEALVRWQHPRRGLLSPSEFIPVAEESHLIVPIGAWVLAEACRQAGSWRALGPVGERLTMSVNLTARQLRHPDLVGQVARAIRQTGLPAPHLKLEITERTIVEDAEAETGVLSQIRRMGVKLAIDDFGTGYSSLGYLRRWPVGTLKIDRSFIETIEHDAGARKLVAAMAGLGHALGADVTVEGIETAGQLTWLRGIGIERGQGFYFAPPLPADEFARLLTRDEAYDLTSATDLGPLTMLRDTIAANDGRMAR